MKVLYITFSKKQQDKMHLDASVVYRCFNPALSLTSKSVAVNVIHADQVKHYQLDPDVVICHRPRSGKQLNQVFALYAARSRLLADYDDLLFCQSSIEHHPAAISGRSSHSGMKKSTSDYLDAMLMFDEFIVSTVPLADRIMEIKPVARVHVLHNGWGRDWYAFAGTQPVTSGRRKKICYFAGTSNHDQDLYYISRHLIRFLQENQDTELEVYGAIDLSMFQDVRQQICPGKRVPFYLLPSRIKQAWVSIAPLLDTPFNQSKSAIKFIESGLFGDAGSKQVAALEEVFTEKQTPVHVMDIQLGGSTLPRLVMEKDRLIWNDTDFSSVEAVHVRCMATNTPSSVPPVMHARNYSELRADFLREQEFQSVTRSFFSRLSQQGKLVINSLTHAYVDHDTKAQLYQKLNAAGFCVPDTIMTNSGPKALDFSARHKDIVAKPSIGIGSTRLVNEYDKSRVEELAYSPVLFQELIKGDTIRVHIVGNKVVLALRILKDEDEVDSRTNPQGFEFFKMPDEEEQKIVKATHFLGLHFAAWDVLAAKDGRYAYLDCNPGPFILWIGKQNTRAVFQRLADMMINYSKTRSLQSAYDAVTPCTQAVE